MVYLRPLDFVPPASPAPATQPSAAASGTPSADATPPPPAAASGGGAGLSWWWLEGLAAIAVIGEVVALRRRH